MKNWLWVLHFRTQLSDKKIIKEINLTNKQIKDYGFTFIKDSLENNSNFIERWDDKAKVPYLLITNQGIIITYENEQSMRVKCQSVSKNNMAGVMFREYFSDPREYL